MATKKAGWTTKNNRDSNPKYRGVKLFWWQQALAWNIIIRQKGNKYELGDNVYMWRDFSIMASVDWTVTFGQKNYKRFDGKVYTKTFVSIK